VTLSLCSQGELDREVQKSARRLERERKEQAKAAAPAGGTLLPTEETTAEPVPAAAVSEILTAEVAAKEAEPAAKTQIQQDDEEAAGVFAKLAALKPKTEEQEREQKGE
jgi:hypothetical protein